MSVKELASTCAADPDGLDRVLRLLAAHGIFERRGPGGRERMGGQLGALLEAAGFTDPRVLDTGGPMRIVEAVAA